MARTCTICAHPDRAAIDQAIVSAEANRNIAKRFDISPAAVHRHASNHLPAALVAAQEVAELADATDLLQQVAELVTTARGILKTAQTAKDLRTALLAIRETGRLVELQVKMIAAAIATAPPPEREYDFSQVSDEELEQLIVAEAEQIMARRQGPQSDSG